MQFLEKVPRVPYDELRRRFRPGDALFFGPLPLSEIRSLADVGGFISNQGIRLFQYPGSGHLGWFNAIHVEGLLPVTIAGQLRWLSAGMTNSRNAAGGGLAVTSASWRAMYRGMLLYLPVRHELRAGLTEEFMLARVEAVAGTPYGAENLLAAVTNRPVVPTTMDPYCSSWMLGNYVEAGTVDDTDYCTDGRTVGAVPVNPQRYSVNEFIRDYKTIWKWRAAALVA